MSSKNDKPPVDLDKIGDFDLNNVPKLEDCKPGIRPSEYNVFIIQAEVSETIGKGGLILAADTTKEKASASAQLGRIIRVSPLAFNFDAWTNCEDKKPKEGDVIWFARFAGGEFHGRDGRVYRTIKDKDIIGIVEE